MNEALKEVLLTFAVLGGFFGLCLIGFGIIRFADRKWYRERRDRNDR